MKPGLCALLLIAGLFFGACGDAGPLPAEDLAIRVLPGAEDVVLGQSFDLTVVLLHRRDLVPEPWREEELAPLAFRLVDVDHREDADRVEERRHYRAWAFTPGLLAIPGPTFTARPRDGGPAMAVTAGALDLRVRTELDPDAPGEPELPEALLSEPFPVLPVLAAVLPVLALAAFLLLRSRGRRRLAGEEPDPGPAAGPPPGLMERTLDRLKRLETIPSGKDGAYRFHLAVSAILRDYLEERGSFSTREKTTEECLAAPPTMEFPESDRARLAEAFRRCDQVKFASLRPDATECPALLEIARAFVRETSSDERSGGSRT